MATSALVAALRRADRPHTSVASDWLFVLTGIWFVGGLFVDGYAHNHFDNLETFFTPWHAIFYSGFAAVASLSMWFTVRERAIPVGYELTIAGVVIFAVGGALDMAWHLAFGIEQDIAALLSPTHLILATGVTLIMAGPLRAAYARNDRRSDWRAMLPALLSATFVLSVFTFFVQFFYGTGATNDLAKIFHLRGDAADEMRTLGIVHGLGTVLVRSALVCGMLFFLMRRFRLPAGAITFLFGVNALLMGFMVEGIPIFYVAGALVAGVVADVLYAKLDVANDAPRLRAFAFLVPTILFVAYIVGYRFFPGFTGYAWNVNLLVGAPIYAGVTGLLLSYLAWPPLAATSRR